MHFGKDNVLAISMLCNSNESDLEDAEEVARNFGVRQINIELSKSFDFMKKEINTALGKQNLSKEALINIKPRLRMTTLYSIAQTLGYLVIGTGNLCEIMVRIYYEVGR